MKARQLIEGAIFDPAQLKITGQAFDHVWEQIAPDVSGRPEAIEAARMKLANIILDLAKDGTQSFDQLTELAVKFMFADPTEL